MAGAACHELAQPLTTMELLLEKLRRALPPDGPSREVMESLGREVERAGGLVQRISQVGKYVTRPYAQGLRIIDLDAAGSIPIDGGPEGGKEDKP
jgi:signal transduction histidine kinase